MANKQYMIQVLGTTYRIQAEHGHHQVFRVSDDRNLGAFQHQPALRVLVSEIAPEQLLDVARAALRTARLPWAQTALSHKTIDQRADSAERMRRGSAAQTLASLLVLLVAERLRRLSRCFAEWGEAFAGTRRAAHGTTRVGEALCAGTNHALPSE